MALLKKRRSSLAMKPRDIVTDAELATSDAPVPCTPSMSKPATALSKFRLTRQFSELGSCNLM